MSSKPELLPLAFGDAYAVDEADYSATVSFLRQKLKILPKTFMQEGIFEPVFGKKNWYRRHSPFQFKTNNLFLAAGSSSPYSIRVRGDGRDVAFLIGHIGTGQVVTKKNEVIKIVAGRSAALVSNRGSLLEMGVQSGVYLRPNVESLHRTARIMAGLPAGKPFDLGIPDEREIDLIQDNVSIDVMFRHVWKIIDQLLPNADVFDMMGLDDLILRLIVLMLRPDLLAKEADRMSLPMADLKLKTAQDFVYANLNAPIRITDLEEVAGLSQRTLHNLFKKTFDLSPMQWVMQQRLFLVRQRLLKANPSDSVTVIAQACGFINMGRFAKVYFARFGELPSETIKRRS